MHTQNLGFLIKFERIGALAHVLATQGLYLGLMPSAVSASFHAQRTLIIHRTVRVLNLHCNAVYPVAAVKIGHSASRCGNPYHRQTGIVEFERVILMQVIFPERHRYGLAQVQQVVLLFCQHAVTDGHLIARMGKQQACPGKVSGGGQTV